MCALIKFKKGVFDVFGDGQKIRHFVPAMAGEVAMVRLWKLICEEEDTFLGW